MYKKHYGFIYPKKNDMLISPIPWLECCYTESGNHPDPIWVDLVTIKLHIAFAFLGFGFYYKGDWEKTREIPEYK